MFANAANADINDVFIFNPANGSSVVSIDKISVSVDKDNKLTMATYDSEIGSIFKDGVDTGYFLVADIQNADTTNYMVFVINSDDSWDNLTLSEVGSYTITIPAGTFALNNVTYDKDIVLTYKVDGVKITLDTPKQSEISTDGLPEDYVVVVNSNVSGYMKLKINDHNPTDGSVSIIRTGYFQDIKSLDDGSYNYIWTCPQALTFYAGHTYTFDVSLYESDHQGAKEISSASLISFIGTTKVDESSSDISLLSVSPDENITWTVEEDKDVVLTFSSLVKVDKNNTCIDAGEFFGTYELKSIKATGNDTTSDGLSSEWTLTVSAFDVAYFNGDYVTIRVYVNDKDGNTVKDKDGIDHFTLSYRVGLDDGKYSGFSFDPENGATVESLSSISVGYNPEYNESSLSGDGISINWSNYDKIHIYNQNNDVVATISNNDCEMNFASDNPSDPGYFICNEVIIPFAKITEQGTYTVVIPAGFFMLGTYMYAQQSGQITLKYTVNPDYTTSIDSVNTVISEGTEVYNLSGQRISSPVKGTVNIIKFTDGTTKKIFIK